MRSYKGKSRNLPKEEEERGKSTRKRRPMMVQRGKIKII